jgi:serine/threonine protein kinase
MTHASPSPLNRPQVPAEVADLVRRLLCRDRKRRISAEEVLAHPALASVSTSMDDLDRLERERRREKGKEKLGEDEEGDDVGGSSVDNSNNNNNNSGRGMKRVRNEEASAW